MPTYNRAKFLQQAINSCLEQTYKNIELIIVDDGSSDDTFKIAESYKDQRIKYIRHEKNKGLPSALNTGFAKALGDYFTWTSDDNLFLPNAIEKMVSFLKASSYPFVYCDFYAFYDNDIFKRKLVKLPSTPLLAKGNCIGFCFLYSKNVQEEVGEYDVTTQLAEDYDYWIRVTNKFAIGHLDAPLYLVRMHKESLFKSKFYEIKVVDFLVRFKHGLLTIQETTDLFIELIAKKRTERFQPMSNFYYLLFKITKLSLRFFTYKKIIKTLEDFKTKNISITTAKQIFENEYLFIRTFTDTILNLRIMNILKKIKNKMFYEGVPRIKSA